MPKDLTGKRLERLVAALERALNGANGKVEAPCRRLIDKDTKEPREHDIVITWDHGHHKVITAIECRDRSRPVGVPDVEAFVDKCLATGVHCGVIVSASGFRKTARKKAESRSIICMELAEAEEFDWLGTSSIAQFTRRISKVNFAFPSVHLSRQSFEGCVYSETGRKVPMEQLARLAISRISIGPMPDEPVGEEHTILVPLVTKGWTITGKDGTRHPIGLINAEITSEITRTDAPISRHHYAGNGKEYAIASAEVAMQNAPGRVVMVKNDDGSTSVYLIPDKP